MFYVYFYIRYCGMNVSSCCTSTGALLDAALPSLQAPKPIDQFILDAALLPPVPLPPDAILLPP
jgi:hypothetical protein